MTRAPSGLFASAAVVAAALLMLLLGAVSAQETGAVTVTVTPQQLAFSISGGEVALSGVGVGQTVDTVTDVPGAPHTE
jgi:ABC-type transporter Mla subunit MlaD